ncbi:MAG TPA: GIY-YIG nuclease family protein [Candidatus Omnitrophota bacterium]|nr:GIY-YIG nuclease family protein [Candidatus Omnitrophota bacterium]HPD84510.1 GIY-YIG nuclease family protein [Candidatus Omnitrophota bacterium]HRZ03368.1 GIY-YIG nuclease family protein [Candidatus Omnitrophota bacterium]
MESEGRHKSKPELILRREAAKDPIAMNRIWHVYILECADGKLYVGIALDVQKRFKVHNQGLACRFTKFRHPVQLLYSEPQIDYRSARKREKELKGFSRSKKITLISRNLK